MDFNLHISAALFCFPQDLARFTAHAPFDVCGRFLVLLANLFQDVRHLFLRHLVHRSQMHLNLEITAARRWYAELETAA